MTVALVAACSIAVAVGGPFDGYGRMSAAKTANLLVDPSFDLQTGEKAWAFGAEAKVSVSYGKSQRGLGYVRTDPKAYSLSSQRIPLKPMTKYVFGGKVRTKGGKPEDILACLAIEWFDGSPVHKQGTFVSGQYNWVRGGSLDWTDAEFEITTGAPAENRHYFFVVYLQRGMTGEVAFDDLFIREAGGALFAGLLNPYNRLDGDDRTLHIAVNTVGKMRYPGAEEAELAAAVTISRVAMAGGPTSVSAAADGTEPIPPKDGTEPVPPNVDGITREVPIRNGRCSVDAKTLEDGAYTARLTIADKKAKLVLAELEPLGFTVGAPTVPKPLRGAVTIDKYGRTLVDGKPFLPIGVYTGGYTTPWEQEYFKKSPFNTILTYHSFFYRFASSQKRGTEGIREVLDYLDANGMKLLVSSSTFFPKNDEWLPTLKREYGDVWSNSTHEAFLEMAANGIKDHPALLGYYITDELPPERYRELIARRALFNRIDPYHPTTGVYFKLGEMGAYTATQDAPSIDFYPITGKGPQNQRLVSESMDVANRVWARDDTGAMPFWATLQLFSWSDNDTGCNPDKNKKFRLPTENEHRAMALMSAIGGAKGFIYYYFHDICYATFTNREDWMPRFLENWRTISRALETVKELEPFILSTTSAPKVTVKNVKGETRARAFVDDEYGRIRVLISSVGPGEAEAEITVEGQPQLYSQFARTKHVGDKASCTYRFKGTDVDCDILQRWTERELEKKIR